VLAFLDQNEEITPTSADYRTAASIKAAARKQGSAVELPDCLIAAIAARIECPLATGNTADFQAIQQTGIKLVIENWRVAHSA
jgi:predicted nucleic acid-binding protein